MKCLLTFPSLQEVKTFSHRTEWTGVVKSLTVSKHVKETKFDFFFCLVPYITIGVSKAKLQTIFSVTKRFTKDSHKLRQIMKTIHIEFWEYAFRHVSFLSDDWKNK